MPARRIGATPIVLATVLLGCIEDPPPSSYVEVTEVFTVRHSVVELGPIAPARVGPLIAGYDSPIAEVMPGDRLRLEVIVVDTEGLRVTELETLWVQCGSGPCDLPGWGWGPWSLDNPDYEVGCDERIVYTTDDFCLLGIGTDALEFVVPELGPEIARGYAQIGLYGVVAWGGRRVEDCWSARRGERIDLDRCGFIHHSVPLGPVFLVYTRAFDLGLYVEYENVDFSAIPDGLLQQPANRIPKTPELEVRVDGEQVASGVPPFPLLRVEPGSSIEISFAFDPLTQLFQRYFLKVGYDDEYDTFELASEKIYSRTATTGAIVQTGDFEPVEGDGQFTYVVDEFAQPGISRIWIGYRDVRGGNDYLTVEFEHP
jgi:hypothetical protein